MSKEVNSPEVSLGDFDKDFYESIDGRENVLIREGGLYHTILVDGQKVGIVGYIPLKSTNFVQIALAKAFRGKGLVPVSEELLAKRYGLKELTATVDLANKASMLAHQKAGFKTLPEGEIKRLRELGFLKENQIRMVKSMKEVNR